MERLLTREQKHWYRMRWIVSERRAGHLGRRHHADLIASGDTPAALHLSVTEGVRAAGPRKLLYYTML